MALGSIGARRGPEPGQTVGDRERHPLCGGAVSGTVLSFELGLLWPQFMAWAGGAIGVLFSLEGFAFFTEAIFLGIYLYGWRKLSPGGHIFAGVLVTLSGIASTMFVVSANAWMNTPAGIEMAEGRIIGVNPLEVMLNPTAVGEVIRDRLSSRRNPCVALTEKTRPCLPSTRLYYRAVDQCHSGPSPTTHRRFARPTGRGSPAGEVGRLRSPFSYAGRFAVPSRRPSGYRNSNSSL